MQLACKYFSYFLLALAFFSGCRKQNPDPPKEEEKDDPIIFPDLKGPDCRLVSQKTTYTNLYYYDAEHMLTDFVYGAGKSWRDSITMTYAAGKVSYIAHRDTGGIETRHNTYTYNDTGQLLQYSEYYKNFRNGQEPATIVRFEYKGSNLPIKIIYDLTTGMDFEIRPEYDAQGNRIRETQVYLSDSSLIRTIVYTYDNKPNYRRNSSTPGSITWFNRNNIEKEYWSARGYEENTVISTYQYNDKDLVVKENYFNRQQETTRTFSNSYECW